MYSRASRSGLRASRYDQHMGPTETQPGDTSSQRRAAGNEAVIDGQRRALELAINGAPLAAVLDVIVRTVEAQSTRDLSVVGGVSDKMDARIAGARSLSVLRRIGMTMQRRRRFSYELMRIGISTYRNGV